MDDAPLETFQDGISACFDMALDTVERANADRVEHEPCMSRENVRDLLWAAISLYSARAGSYAAGYAILRMTQLWEPNMSAPSDRGGKG